MKMMGVQIVYNNILELKSEFLNDYYLIIGDTNARIGDQQDLFDDRVTNIPNMDWYPESTFLSSRKSKDKTVNAFGVTLLEVCLELDMHVLNGRKGLDIEGEFTNVIEVGCSMVDYIIASTEMFSIIEHFEILNDPDIHVSTHLPLVCIMNPYPFTEGQEQETDNTKITTQLTRYKWREEAKDQFVQVLEEHECKFKEIDEECLNVNYVDNVVAGFVSTLQNACDMFEVNQKYRKQKSNQPDWWDKECTQWKRLKYRNLNKFRRSNLDIHLKDYQATRKTFRHLCREKEALYQENLRKQQRKCI
jgi:hypothetical protein